MVDNHKCGIFEYHLKQRDMKPFVESIQDLKDNREEIIETIVTYLDGDKTLVVEVMKQVARIVTSSNYEEMDIDIYDTIDLAVNDVKRMDNLNGDGGHNHNDMHIESAKRQAINL